MPPQGELRRHARFHLFGFTLLAVREGLLIYLINRGGSTDFIGQDEQRFAVGTVVRADEGHSFRSEISGRDEVEGVGEGALIHVFHQLWRVGIRNVIDHNTPDPLQTHEGQGPSAPM